MSTHNINLTKITAIVNHENAERLEFALCYDYKVVVTKGLFKVGDEVFYIAIDSLLPEDLELLLFPPETSKFKLSGGRIRQIKIRGAASQGLIMTKEDAAKLLINRGLKAAINFELEKDYSELLNIKKFTPPEPEYLRRAREKTGRNKPLENPEFHKYNGLEHLKKFANMFSEGHEVVVEEKLHGSNCRAAKLLVKLQKPKKENKSIKLNKRKQQLKRLFISTATINQKALQFLYGSNNVELTNRIGYKGFYGDDVYGKVLAKVNAQGRLKRGEIVFGELIGKGIQTNYDYGHTKEHHFVLFDVKVLQEDKTYKWLSPEEVEAFAIERGFDFVPVLYRGPFNRQLVEELTKGNSVYAPNQKVREGVVVKSRYDYNDLRFSSNKAALKAISEDYLARNDNTDFQ